MQLIEKLSELVTPHVLAATSAHAGDNSVKSKLLSAFYPLFAARLSDESAFSRISALPADAFANGKNLLDALFNDGNGNSQVAQITDSLAKEFNLPATTATALSAVSAPLILTKIKEFAGAQGVPAFLKSQAGELSSALPAWALALLPAGLLGGAAAVGAANAATGAGAATTASTAATGAAATGTAAGAAAATPKAATIPAKEEEKKGGFLKSLLPIIGLIILGGLAWLLLRGCQDNPAPVAAPNAQSQADANAAAGANGANADGANGEAGMADGAAAAAVAATPAVLNVAVDETGQAVYSCRANAGSEGVIASINTAIAGVFGVDKCELQTDDSHAATMPAAEHLPAVLGLMKGVPSSSVSISDKTVRFNAANEADIAKLIEGAKGILPADFTVEAEPALDVAAAVAGSIDSAKNAINALGDNVSADELVRALNMQIINFASDSNAIPAENQAILDLAAEKLAALPDASLKIIGHTDSQASHEYNQKLSEKRAAAVRDYLVSKGVAAERLQVSGASYDKPVASNATEQGRFQNRRIEFTVLENGEKVASVGAADSEQAK
ncbi:hypothetical protein B0181_01650 [Moraxella caviae]|uniref:Outer membrane protein ArfA n=1 Tax=Moraxella caviae TaxID=34060 RepID=A0A1T0A9X9_9GAMM|nr:OmpA family protein [Moraxella caviae]OOR92468.1 hypothetical protein B0181_01650 [Moraxella caviae]STZ13826.1 Outer membrane protein ArfA [Moraxella caviae]